MVMAADGDVTVVAVDLVDASGITMAFVVTFDSFLGRFIDFVTAGSVTLRCRETL